MFSSGQKVDSSIAKYLVNLNQLDLLEKFILSLAQVRINPGSDEPKNSINQLIAYFNAPSIVIAQDYRKQYIAELEKCRENRHENHWVDLQLHTGILAFIRSHLQEHSNFERNFRILKSMYRLMCVYQLDNTRLNHYLRGKVSFNVISQQSIKKRIESLFLLMGLEDLYLFDPQPTCQSSFEIEKKNKIYRFRQWMLIVREILIDNSFDIQVYNQEMGFKNYLTKIIQEIDQEPYPIFQYSETSNSHFDLTFSERVDFIKMVAFVELNQECYHHVVKTLSSELSRNRENDRYIACVLKPLVVAALDYNLERLAELLNDIITGENSVLAGDIIDWVNQYPKTNATKLFFIEAFGELRFDYDDEEQLYQEEESKVLDHTFFHPPESPSTSKKSLSKGSARGTNSRSTLKASTRISTDSRQNKRQTSASTHGRHLSTQHDIQMFGGTLSRGYQSTVKNTSSSSKVCKTVSDESSTKLLSTASSSSKRALDAPDEPIKKRVKPTVIAEAQPIGRITDYFPEFNLPSAFMNKLPTQSSVIMHARGYHFYRCNTQQKSYYLVTNDQQKDEFKNEIDSQLSTDLHSPAVVALGNASVAVSESVRTLFNTPYVGYPSKLHYLQEVYSNTFDRLNRTLSQAETFFEEYPHKHHPFVSFGDEITHAARYGFGQKVTGDRFQDRLRPVYHEDGSLEHFFVGQLWVTLQSWDDYLASGKFHILSEFAKGNISINDRILNERETSFWSTVSRDIIALRLPLIIPSFYGEYPPHYQQAFGITKNDYKEFKTKIMHAYDDSLKKDQRKASKNIKNEIIEHVIHHYGERIIAQITSAISIKQSTLVYHGLTGQPVAALPSMDAARLLHIYNKYPEEINGLLEYMTHEVENQPASRCIRRFVSINSDGTSISVNREVTAQIREYMTGEKTPLLHLLDFVEQPENEVSILSFFRKEEASKLDQARQLLLTEVNNIKLLLTIPIELIELFLVAIKHSDSATIIFDRIVAIAETLQTRYLFFAQDFQEQLECHFESSLEQVKSLLHFLKHKIENYHLMPTSKESQSTLALPIEATSSTVDHVVSKPSTLRETPNIHPILTELVKGTIASGKQQLEEAIKNADYIEVKKYLPIADAILDAGGNSLLHLAAGSGQPDIIQAVLSKVSRRTEKNKEGLTPVHIACFTGKIAAFEAIYNDSITLNAQHLKETLKNILSSDEEKCKIMNLMFSKGMNVTADELQQLSSQATLGAKALLKYVYDLFMAIKGYIHDATVNTRHPVLNKAILAASSTMTGSRKNTFSRIIQLISKKITSQVKPLSNLMEPSNLHGLSATALATIITRVHQEIPHRGRINVVIAAIIMGDLDFLKKISAYNVNFNLTPNHNSTLNNKPVKKPSIFAIQYARYDIFQFITQQNPAFPTRTNSEEQLLSKVMEQCQVASENLLTIFNQNSSLQQHKEFYQELTTYVRELTTIRSLLHPTRGADSAIDSTTISDKVSGLFHHADQGQNNIDARIEASTVTINYDRVNKL